ncbi:MAG: bacteriophage abortive infection AbiH family protein [Oscillospiraceae bacterium]|nr:bacteriophage abortive infection AbiH family protein [Oscillospiraceae bacterium]
MPNITWIMGNGFDIQLGLETGYKQFYDTYCKIGKEDEDFIQQFKKDLKKNKNSETWADFELAYGKYSDECKDAEKYSRIKADVETQLHKYLNDIQESIDWPNLNGMDKNIFYESAIDWMPEIMHINHNDVIIPKLQKKPSGVINFLLFNYTNTVHNLLGGKSDNMFNTGKNGTSSTLGSYYGVSKFGTVHHVHGNLKGQIILGVDNINQITNTNFCENQDIISEMVKPTQLQDIRDQNPNVDIPTDNAIRIINESAIVCVFGASIGETDKTWWKMLADWLNNNDDRLLIIFNYKNIENHSPITREKRRVQKLQKEYMDTFYNAFKSCADWDDKTYENNKRNIIVVLNENLFNFRLPRKDRGFTNDVDL